jgi:hypothetical protein
MSYAASDAGIRAGEILKGLLAEINWRAVPFFVRHAGDPEPFCHGRWKLIKLYPIEKEWARFNHRPQLRI